MKVSCLILPALLLLTAVPAATAQEKPVANRQLELIPDEPEEFRFEGDRRVNSVTGLPAAVYYLEVPVRHDTPENMARQYLRENARALGLRPDLSDLRQGFTRETPGGYRIRFEQYIGAYRVYKSTITVSINRNDRVVFLTNGYKVPYGESPAGTTSALKKMVASVSASQALQSARARLGITGATRSDTTETIWYFNKGTFRLAQRSAFISTEDRPGAWEVMTDAVTGEIFRVEDKARYSHPIETSGSVDGKGWVFDPDPVTSARSVYGQPGFRDNNDADSPELTAQLFERVLRDITYDPLAGKYFLKGPYAEIIDVEAPYTGLHELDSSTFHFTRSNRTFEAVMCYYHIDKSMRYVNDTLGFPLLPLPYVGGVRADPHGCNGENNAWAMWDGHLAFGSSANATDNAEEAGTILHELFHLLHEWVSGYGGSWIEGLGEGCADYWAVSDARSYHYFSPSDQQYNWFGPWGGLPYGDAPYLRVTNWPNHYPDRLTGSPWTDGQMWSSSLMSIYDVIGKEVTDRLLLEGLSMTDINSSQRDAAFAFLQADKDLYGGAHLGTIVPVFSARGYLTKAVTARFESDVTGGQSPLTVRFSSRSFATSGAAISCSWDFNDDGIVDASGSDVTHTFTETGLHTVSLIAIAGTAAGTLRAVDYVSVNSGVFLWDYFYDPANCSGPVIESELEKLGVAVSRSRALRAPSSLLGYEVAFLSLGGGWYDGTSVDSALFRTIAEFLEHGGRLYIEGVQPLRAEFSTLLPLVGVAEVKYSLAQVASPVITGRPSSLCSGLLFKGAVAPDGQSHFIAGNGGVEAFAHSTIGGIIGIQNEGAGGQKSFVLAYNLSNFNESPPTNTRLEFLTRLIRWFGLTGRRALVTPPSLSFTQVPVHQASDTAWVRIENIGNQDLSVTGLSNQDSTFEILRQQSLPHVVAPGSAMDVGIVFRPQSVGLVKDTLTVTTDDPVRSQRIVAITGSTPTPVISMDTRSVDFRQTPNTIVSRDTTFMVRNVGLAEDSIYVSLNYGNVVPDSGIAVSPQLFALPAHDSAEVTFTIRPQLLIPQYYSAVVRVQSRFGAGQTLFSKAMLFEIVAGPDGVMSEALPTEFALEQNYPNPFNPSTTIRYGLPSRSHGVLTVHNTLGQQVATLVEGEQEAGFHEVQFDASGLASGVYLYRLQAGDFVSTKSMLILK